MAEGSMMKVHLGNSGEFRLQVRGLGPNIEVSVSG